MVNGSADLMAGTLSGRKVGFHGGPDGCADCGGLIGYPGDNGYCPHPHSRKGFLKPGRRIPLPYEVKDALLLALFRLGPEGGFRHQLIDILPLSPEALDGALRRSRRSNHVVRSLQREQLPVRGTAYRHPLTWRGLAYLWERFGLQFET